MPRPHLIACAAVLIFAQAIRAEINVGDSLEWLIAGNPDAAIVEIVGRGNSKNDEGAWRVYEVKLKTTIKGKPPEKATITLWIPEENLKKAYGEAELSPPDAGAEFLVIWSSAKEVVNAIDLTHPLKKGVAGHGVAFTNDGHVLAARADIVKSVEGAAKAVDLAPVPAVIDLGSDTEAYKALWSGSACGLRIPVSTAWIWHEEEATIDGSIKNNSSPYTIEANRLEDHFGSVELVIKREGKLIHTVKCHNETPFVITGDRLIYAEHSMISDGCTLVVFSLSGAKELWRTPLKALGEIPHSKYRNQVALKVTGNLAIVTGKESAGNYLEIVDLQTGKTVFHRTVDKERH
jgi:hypothetical protein